MRGVKGNLWIGFGDSCCYSMHFVAGKDREPRNYRCPMEVLKIMNRISNIVGPIHDLSLDSFERIGDAREYEGKVSPLRLEVSPFLALLGIQRVASPWILHY